MTGSSIRPVAGARVWYGEQRLDLDLPAGTEVLEVAPPRVEDAPDALALVAAALDRPIGSAPLLERARGIRRATVVVPDPSRATPASVYLLPVVARLAMAGLAPRSISVVVARGIHPAAPRSALERVLGAEVMGALRPVQSAPMAPDHNVSVGTDEEIGEVRVHRLVAEADLVVLTGAVVPHHLAGFGGGPKAFVPGVADRETVLAAHRLTLRTVLRPDGAVRSVAGRLEPNPFRDALLRVVRRFDRAFLLNVVADDEGRILGAAAGEVGGAHARAAALWTEKLGGVAAGAADLVVVGGRAPRDHDLIQAHKALLFAASWARPGAPIVWLARAPGGPGHVDLLPWFEIRGLDRHLAALRRDFHPYGLTAYSIRRLAKDHPVHVVSQVSRDLLRPMGLLPEDGPEAALRHALAEAAGPRVAVLPVGAW